VPTLLRASVREASGAAAPLDPYMHMLGHALVLRSDGAVFAHVHPAGTLSLAAARHFAAKSGGEAAARAVEALCGDLEVLPQPEAAELSRKGEIGFPYVFPTPGAYLIWVQAKVRGTVVTGAFRLQVGPPAPGPAR
ncbi:MAG TPA: hypothetical protein DCM86_16415, partial [Verrucomicrobiales bacterium]|nr:hypothetical protein [Verrucomicrobiales bacterium]